MILTPFSSRFFKTLAMLSALLLTVYSGPSRANDLALIIGRRSKGIERAIQAIKMLPNVRAVRLNLYEGLSQVDQARNRLLHHPFVGILAFGDQAHEFLLGLHQGKQWYTIFSSLPASETILSPKVPPEEWTHLLEKLIPESDVLNTLLPAGEAPAFFSPLQLALNASGHQLIAYRPAPGESLHAALNRVLRPGTSFLLPPIPALMKRKNLLQALNTSHRRKVPLFTFSKVLVKAGALAALTVSPEVIGRRGAALALGQKPPPLVASLSLNTKRAAYLGIQIPKELLSEAKNSDKS
jgi:hypothetical protein